MEKSNNNCSILKKRTFDQINLDGTSEEGIDRTSVDILQFAGGSTAAPSSASAPTGFAALAQMAPNKRKFF